MDIHPAAKIGKGVMFDHANGIVIGETAVVGDHCVIFHNVTLGGSSKDLHSDRHPKLGKAVLVGAGDVHSYRADCVWGTLLVCSQCPHAILIIEFGAAWEVGRFAQWI